MEPRKIWCNDQPGILISNGRYHRCSTCGKIEEFFENFWDSHQVRNELRWKQGVLFPEQRREYVS